MVINMKLDLYVYKDGEVYLHEENDYVPALHAHTTDKDFNEKLRKVIDEMVKKAPR